MPRRGPTPDFNQVTLKWAGVTLDGAPVTGRLELTYNRPNPMLDDDATFPVAIYPTVQTKTLTTAVIQVEGDVAGVLTDRQVGYASWMVPASDDPDIEGSGGTYTLTEKLDNAKGMIRTFVASKDAVGGVIWLNRISSVTPVPGEVISAVSVGDFNLLKTRVDTLQGGGVTTPGGTALTTYSQVAALVGYPTVFPPAAHTHGYADVTGLDGAVDALVDQSLAGKADLDGNGRVLAAQIPSITSAKVSDFNEAAQDAIAAMLAAGTGVTLSYNDAANSLTITGTAGAGSSLDVEAVRDAIGVALIGAGLISITVNDAADTITVTTTATANSTDAQLRDRGTHTGAQAISTVTQLQAELDARPKTYRYTGTAWPVPVSSDVPGRIFDSTIYAGAPSPASVPAIAALLHDYDKWDRWVDAQGNV